MYFTSFSLNVWVCFDLLNVKVFPLFPLSVLLVEGVFKVKALRKQTNKQKTFFDTYVKIARLEWLIARGNYWLMLIFA